MENSESKDEAYGAKIHELIKFAVSSAKRDMHKVDTSQGQEMLQSHIRTLTPKNNETDQS